MNRTIDAITAELNELYAEDPGLVRIDPAVLQQIEAANGYFDFQTGKVWLPPAPAPRPQRIVAGFGLTRTAEKETVAR